MKKTKFKKEILILCLYIIVMLCLTIFRHNTLQSSYGLGIEERIIVNTLKGDFFYNDDWNTYSLGNHFHVFSFLILTPVYTLFPSIHTITFMQILAIAISGYILLLLAKEKGLNKKETNIVFYSFLLFPLIINLLLEDVHAVVYSVPLILLLFLFLHQNKNKSLIFAAVLLSLVQEDMALIVIALGIYILFFEKKKRQIGVLIAIIGLIALIVIPNIIMPKILNADSPWNQHYSSSSEESEYIHFSFHYKHLGNNMFEVFKTIISRPVYSLTYTPFLIKINFLKALLLPLLLIPLFSPVIIVAIPTLMEILLKSDIISMCPNSYRVAPVIAVLFVSLIDGVLRIKKLIPKKRVALLLKAMFIVIIATLLVGEVGHWFAKDYFLNNNYLGGKACKKIEFKLNPNNSFFKVSRNYKTIKQHINTIPKEASIIVPFHLFSQFSSNTEANTFFLGHKCINKEYIIFDSQDVYFPSNLNMKTEIKKIIESQIYETYYSEKDFVILRKVKEEKYCFETDNI
ncbi:DUF2079 domain-containing protein [Bacteroidota bacterium]